MPPDVGPLLRAVAAHRLDPTRPSPRLSVDRDTWTAAAPVITRGRLTGLACLAVADGALELDPEGLADLAARDRSVQAQTVRAEALTLQLCDDLRTAGIEHRVLKGPTVGHRAYPDPCARPFVDVDMLVRGEDLAEVIARFARRGATRPVPELRPGFDRRFAKSVTLRDAGGIEIDVHRTLAVGPLTHLVPIEDLWADPVDVQVVPDRAIPALPVAAAFVHACLQTEATSGRKPRWLCLRDAASLARVVDLEACAALARRWSATGVVRDAVGTVARHGLADDTLRGWRATLVPTAREEAVAGTYQAEDRSARSFARASLRYVHGTGAKLAYAWALASPSRANRAARLRSLPKQVRRVAGSRR